MKRRKKYTMSDKRKLRDAKQADWSKRMRVVELKDEGLTYEQISEKMGCTKANIWQMYHKAKKQLPQ